MCVGRSYVRICLALDKNFNQWNFLSLRRIKKRRVFNLKWGQRMKLHEFAVISDYSTNSIHWVWLWACRIVYLLRHWFICGLFSPTLSPTINRTARATLSLVELKRVARALLDAGCKREPLSARRKPVQGKGLRAVKKLHCFFADFPIWPMVRLKSFYPETCRPIKWRCLTCFRHGYSL